VCIKKKTKEIICGGKVKPISAQTQGGTTAPLKRVEGEKFIRGGRGVPVPSKKQSRE